jgi:hypothetical protein
MRNVDFCQTALGNPLVSTPSRFCVICKANCNVFPYLNENRQYIRTYFYQAKQGIVDSSIDRVLRFLSEHLGFDSPVGRNVQQEIFLGKGSNPGSLSF